MKTPYDTALRALAREVEAMRTAVHAAVDRLSDAEGRRSDIKAAIAREASMAALHSAFPAHAYLARAGRARDELDRLCAEADDALEALRTRARTSYGALNAMETAADGFRADATRAAASAEQARNDDFAATRFVRALKPAR